MDTTRTTYARVYSETIAQIDRHLSRVSEGRDVDAACFFARWLFWSGIPALLKENASPLDTPQMLKCDGSHLAWKVNELIEACNEYYRTNRPAGVQATELESLREKVDKLTSNLEVVAGQLSKLTWLIGTGAVQAPLVADPLLGVPARPRPPALPGGGAGGEPSSSKCHNSIEEKEPNRINVFEGDEK